MTYTTSRKFPIPANLFPQKQDRASSSGTTKSTRPCSSPSHPQKHLPGYTKLALQPLFPSIPEYPLAAFVSFPKMLWRQLDVSPELSERWHSPKHHFPKPPHQQLFLIQPKAFPRGASAFICSHLNLWGRFCEMQRGTFKAEHESAVLEQPWSSSPLPMGEAGSIRHSCLQETPVYFNKNNNNNNNYYCLCF